MARDLDLSTETVRPIGFVYAPAGPRLDPEAIVGRADSERWNRDGELAWYLASDPQVVLAEWARHLDRDVPMIAWRIALRELRLIDLRRPDVVATLALPPEPTWALDRGRTQAVASMIRRGSPADGLVVPSVAFLDQPDKGNLVVWLDDRTQVRGLIRTARPIGRWSWSEDAGR